MEEETKTLINNIKIVEHYAESELMKDYKFKVDRQLKRIERRE